MKKWFLTFLPALLVLANSCQDGFDKSGDMTGPGGDAGTGGSMARFTLAGNKLYVVDQNSLRTFDVSQAANPRAAATIPVGIGIETIYPYGDNLFVGASDAMYIYDIADPAQPRLLSRYNHFVACDPVVVQGHYAYVTLRTTGCRRAGSNVLDVIDISDLRNPQLVRTLNMSSPYGLGIRGNSLFVCEGTAGLRVLDATDPLQLVEKSLVTGISTYDVIPLPQSLLVVGQDGFLQYDYTDLASLKLLSRIDVAKE